MATINSVGSGLKGTTGTGTFVGSTSPTITNPVIATINHSNGSQVCSFNAGTSSVNRISMASQPTGQNVLFGVAGSDTNISMNCNMKGTGVFYVSSQTLVGQLALTDNNSYARLQMSPLGGDNLYTFPGNCPNGNIVCDTSGNNGITTAPPASQSASLTVGTAYRNTLGYDVVVTVYLAVTAATSADIFLGVGPTTTPGQQVIISAITLGTLTIIPIPIYLPSQYYAVLSTNGTITQSISGQITMPI